MTSVQCYCSVPWFSQDRKVLVILVMVSVELKTECEVENCNQNRNLSLLFILVAGILTLRNECTVGGEECEIKEGLVFLLFLRPETLTRVCPQNLAIIFISSSLKP